MHINILYWVAGILFLLFCLGVLILFLLNKFYSRHESFPDKSLKDEPYPDRGFHIDRTGYE